MGGQFYRTETYQNAGLDLGIEASYEDLLEQREKLLGLDESKPRKTPEI